MRLLRSTSSNRLPARWPGAVRALLGGSKGRAAWAPMLAACVMTVWATGCARQEPVAEPVRAVRSQIVSTGGGQAGVSWPAEVKARTESRLAFRVGGKLVERPAQLGDVVRKGQVLARLDGRDLQSAEAAVQASLRAAQANAQQAEADAKRFANLHEQGFISAAELERRTTAARAAHEQWAQARAQADIQGRQTAYGVLQADASGVITAVEAEPGSVLAAGTPVVRLAWDGPRDVVFHVPEDQQGALRALQGRVDALEVEGWGEGAFKARGTVREVAAAADPVTRTFLVRAGLSLPGGMAAPRLGQTATVRMAKPPGNGGDSRVRVPLSAVYEVKGQATVWVVEGRDAAASVRQQTVTVAGTSGDEVILAAGLTAGQEVVTAGVHALSTGQKVKRWAQAAPSAAAPSLGAAPASAPGPASASR